MSAQDKGNHFGAPMRAAPARGRISSLMMVVFVLLSGLQAATQSAAFSFDFDASLGRSLGGFYAPWKVLVWAKDWNEQAPDVFSGAMGAAMALMALELLAALTLRSMAANTARPSLDLHGSARWAKEKDIQEAGLLRRSDAAQGPREPGVYVGGWTDEKGRFHYLRHTGPEHVLTYAPTRSGKGVALVIPTLLSWGPSVVVADLKSELWAMTSGWRQKHAGNKVLRFEPAAVESIAWNPLAEIRFGTPKEVGDVQNLATLIVCPNGGDMDSHWQKTAFSLLVGVILHALYKARDEGTTATLPMIDAMLADPQGGASALWAEMASYPHIDGAPDPNVAMAARDMLDRAEEEAGSVLSSTKSYLSLYRDPVVAKNVTGSGFRIKDLMHADTPVSLYIVTQPTDKLRLRPLVRILLNMIVRVLADKQDFEDGQPVPSYKHRLLMMLDEFPSLGRLEVIEESLAYVAGYGIKCCLICQDTNQLRSETKGYGKDETITSNCHVQNAFPPNRLETAEHLSKLTGVTTAIKEQITTSGSRGALAPGQASKTYQEVQRPLLTADECLRMRGAKKSASGKILEAGDMVVYVAGYPAIYGRQPLYFKDPIFAARARIPAPAQSDRFADPVPQPRIAL